MEDIHYKDILMFLDTMIRVSTKIYLKKLVVKNILDVCQVKDSLLYHLRD